MGDSGEARWIMGIRSSRPLSRRRDNLRRLQDFCLKAKARLSCGHHIRSTEVGVQAPHLPVFAADIGPLFPGAADIGPLFHLLKT